MSSRLFTEVREKRGLAYYVSSDYNEFHDNGYLAASAGVDIKRVKEAIKVILAEFRRIKKEGITAKELIQAKDNLGGRLYLGLEDSFSVAGFLGEQELLSGKIKTPEQIIAEIRKVTLEDVQKLSSEIFVNQGLNLAIIGPYKDKSVFDKILKI